MGFVRFSEITQIISLNSINWLLFLMEMEYVFCEVRTETYILDELQVSEMTAT
jgi:hypothetical protein